MRALIIAFLYEAGAIDRWPTQYFRAGTSLNDFKYPSSGFWNKAEATSRPSSALASLLLATPSLSMSTRKRNIKQGMFPSRRAPLLMDTQVSKSESARSTGLALALDDGTRKSHSIAENTRFVTGFFKGISTPSAFSQLVASLYFVYREMEKAFEESPDVNVKALDYPELRRVPSLEEDMAYYFGNDWRDTVKPTIVTQEYCDRIATIAKEKPYLLIAHMYTRYLGDLFGGQMMRGMARSSLKLDEHVGTRFYEFDQISSAKNFIEQWYTQLNELELSDKHKQEIVDEANLVFTFNINLFNELEGGKRSVLKVMWGLLRDKVKASLR